MNHTVFKVSSISACWVAIIWQVCTFPKDAPQTLPTPEAAIPVPTPVIQTPIPTTPVPIPVEPEDDLPLPLPTERDIIGTQLMLAQEWPTLESLRPHRSQPKKK